ncbi:MAG: hypothetical protein JNK82_36565 [Myxococcaceae bacterium]|nr:hypothetical protein [Myxococcaceae bacterium]
MSSWRGLLVVVAVSACGPEFEGEEPGEDPRDEELRQADAALGTLNMHNLMTDEDMAGFEDVTVAQVQGFLVSKGSFLAGYRDPKWSNKTAAQLIVERSRAYDINPVYMLARIETESGLIRSGTSNNLAKATGCACPDSGGCSASWAGFGNQIECSASKFRNYLIDLEAGRTTISGWKKGAAKRTLDNCLVTPANNATAALYTYTPWVGAYASQCGTSQWGGSSLVALLYKNFKSSSVFASNPPQTALVIESNNARNDATRARVSVSANWTSTTATPGYYGTGYYYASAAPVSDAADFWFYLPVAGTRTIDAWWTAGSNRSAAAPFVIEDAAGTRVGTVNVNQQANGGKWNTLGTFSFTQGWNRVRLSRWTSSPGVVIADAVRVR